MEETSTYESMIHDPQTRKLLAEEYLIAAVADELAAAMQKAGVSRSELAERIGCSKAYITQLLGGKNLTLRTLAGACDALGALVNVQVTFRGGSAGSSGTVVRLPSVRVTEDLEPFAQ